MTKRAKPVSDKVRLEIIHQKKNYSISDTKLGGIFGVSVSKIRRIWLEYRINMKSRRSNYNRSGDVWKESKILGQNIYKNKEWCKLLGDIKCKRGRGNVNVEESRMITSQNIETASPPKIILNIQELESPRGVLNTENLACSEAFSSIHLGHPGGLSTQCPSSNLSSQLLPASPTTLFTPLNTTDLYSTPPQNRIKYYKVSTYYIYYHDGIYIYSPIFSSNTHILTYSHTHNKYLYTSSNTNQILNPKLYIYIYIILYYIILYNTLYIYIYIVYIYIYIYIYIYYIYIYIFIYRYTKAKRAMQNTTCQWKNRAD